VWHLSPGRNRAFALFVGYAPRVTTASLPTALSAGERVPQLRADLQITTDGSQGAILLDPTSGTTHSLRDVEVSLARMLNGQRTSDEVVAAAQRIGLPITIETLGRFVGKLSQLGLLAPLDTPPGNGPWPDRAVWATPARELYQEALRAFRSDRHQEAIALLERALSEAPSPEAEQLLAQVRTHAAGGALRSFSQEWGALEQSWFATEAGPSPVEEVALPPPARRSKAPLILLGLLAVATGAAVLVPFPASVVVPVMLKSRSSQPVTLARAGKLGTLEVTEGQVVQPGAVLARYDVTLSRAAVASGQDKVKALKAKIAAPDKKRAGVKAAQDKAEAALAKAVTALAKAEVAAKGKQTPAVKAAAKAKAAAEKKAEAARAAYAASGGDAAVKLAKELEDAEKALATAQAELAAETVTAPIAGQVTRLAAKPGEAVKSGAELLRLDDAAVLRTQLDVTPKDRAALKVGQPVPMSLGGKSVQAKVSKVDDTGAEAEVDNADRALKPGATGSATLDLGRRSMIGRL
jgi:multidrug efflux pump subunit AcrA (membrane-fusion protein)